MPGQIADNTARAKSRSGTKKRNSVKRTVRKTAAGDTPDTAFIEALSADFQQYGASAIAQVRQDDPVTYMKLCASVLLKSVINSIDPLASLTDEELQQRARHLAAKADIGTRPDPERTGPTSEP